MVQCCALSYATRFWYHILMLILWYIICYILIPYPILYPDTIFYSLSHRLISAASLTFVARPTWNSRLGGPLAGPWVNHKLVTVVVEMSLRLIHGIKSCMLFYVSLFRIVGCSICILYMFGSLISGKLPFQFIVFGAYPITTTVSWIFHHSKFSHIHSFTCVLG